VAGGWASPSQNVRAHKSTERRQHREWREDDLGMTWHDSFISLGRTVASRHELIAAGASGRMLTAAVAGGSLVRIRRDHYALPSTANAIQKAVRVGGRVACVSALRAMSVFVVDSNVTHIHLPREASRLRSPANRRVLLSPDNRAGAHLHWWPLLDPAGGDETIVGIEDALAQVIRCQPTALAVASLDNALHLGLVDRQIVAAVLDQLPRSYRRLGRMLDSRSEAGQESVLRLLLDSVGLRYEVQVEIPGVGRVDFVVEGVLVLEADSRLAHHGWDAHIRDRGRDLALARRGFMSLRPAYQHTMQNPNLVIAAVLRLLATRGIHPPRA
jgi:very-short-patch-repair endonuclease